MSAGTTRRERVLRSLCRNSSNVTTVQAPSVEQILRSASRRQKRFTTPTDLDADILFTDLRAVLPEDLEEAHVCDGVRAIVGQDRNMFGSEHTATKDSGSDEEHAFVPLERNRSGAAHADKKHVCSADEGCDDSSSSYGMVQRTREFANAAAKNCRQCEEACGEGGVHRKLNRSIDDGVSTCAPSSFSKFSTRSVSSRTSRSTTSSAAGSRATNLHYANCGKTWTYQL